MNKYDIESQNIEFKNLFSGPAPVGRILNYVYLIGTTGLKHKNGNRTTSLKDGIGYAWTTEFMIGLGIAYLGSPVNNAFILKLTEDGQALFDLMGKKTFEFNEGFHDNDIETVKVQIDSLHPDLYTTFKEVFLKSYPFLILNDYLNEKGYYFSELRTFYDDFFFWAENKFNISSDEENAGYNRLPSLIQLCKLFDLAETDGGLVFKTSKIRHQQIPTIKRAYTREELKESAEKEQKILEFSAEDLVSRYGEDGTVVVSAIVRNSSLQSKFKHNLMIKQKSKCVICGMEQKELLIGSHIKSSAESDVNEKIDHNNGLLLCCNHDKLFDKHLISFDDITGKIMISRCLKQDDIKRLNLSDDFALDKALLTEERQKYLRIHNSKFKEEEILRN